MSLFVPGVNRWNFRVHNFGTNPSASPGTSITPGASNGEGSYTECIAAASLTEDCMGLFLRVADGNTTGQVKDHLLDIGVDPAGGTSWSALISNIVCGESSGQAAVGAVGYVFYFPILIKAGSSVAVRIQGSNATAGTVSVGMKLYGKPSHPESVKVGTFSETIGTITNSGGVSYSPGNGADGTWVSLGTTAHELWWWQIGQQLSQATMTANRFTRTELAYGDASNKHIILSTELVQDTAERFGQITTSHLSEGYCHVPAGGELWVRGRSGGGGANSGHNAVAIGIGG